MSSQTGALRDKLTNEILGKESQIWKDVFVA